MPCALRGLARLRAAAVPTGVVSNQSGVARGLITEAQVAAVNARLDALIGPIDVWEHCPCGPDDGCACRKPRPGLLLAAARRLEVAPEACVVVGDRGSDMAAAAAVGARGILVATAQTPSRETAAAPEVAPDLAAAIASALSPARSARR